MRCLDRTWTAALVAAVMVAGCSDGGGGDGVDSPDVDSFAELAGDLDELTLETSGLSATDPSTLPTAGSARYEGVMVMDVADEAGTRLAGDLNLGVNFGNDADALSGSVTNIVASTEERWSGALAINGGALDRSAEPTTDSTFGANLEGTITDPTQTAFDVDARMTGDFARSDAEYITGNVGGEACSAGDCSAITGGFLGEED